MRVVDDEVVVAMDRRNLLNNRGVVVGVGGDGGDGGSLSVALDDANSIMIPNLRRVCGVYVGYDDRDEWVTTAMMTLVGDALVEARARARARELHTCEFYAHINVNVRARGVRV